MKIGVDTGGTFTDLVLEGKAGAPWVTLKIPSTPDDPSRAVLAGIDAMLEKVAGDLGEVGLSPHESLLQVIHGSTVATNALLEGKGGRVCLLCTKGFEDVLWLARQQRDDLYALVPQKTQPPMARHDVFGVSERVLYNGEVLVPLSEEVLSSIVSWLSERTFDAVCICLLHSYANPSHEERIAARVSEAFPACHVTVSSSLLREFREYERTTTCLVNAVVAKPMGAYIKRLQDALKEHQLRIMSSSGGTVSPSFVQSNPVVTMLSGPAGGVVGAFAQACQAGEDRILTVDMGGTSTDVGLCHGALARTNESEIADLPVRLLTMDIATVGAGGGSIAWVDTGGALRVGPESMGANPGPAAYGKQDPPYTPTVTDAHVVLGHLHEGARLAGSMSLDVEAARRAVSTLGRQLGLSMEEVADGILRVAEANMARAVQKVTMQKGHDPRDSVLVPFGGAGGLHACRLASLLGMKKVWLPLFPGLLSATGMLLAPLVLDLSQSTMLRIRRDDFGVYPEPSLLPAVQTIQKALKVRADKQLLHESGWEGELTFSFEVGLRYAGQSYEMTVPLLESGTVAAFERKHEALYGYVAKERDLELVVVRFSVRSLTGEFPASTTSSSLEKSHLSPMDRVPMFVDGKWEEGVVLTRDALRDGNVLMGPALLSEYSATTLVPRGWFARVMPTGQVLISGE